MVQQIICPSNFFPNINDWSIYLNMYYFFFFLEFCINFEKCIFLINNKAQFSKLTEHFEKIHTCSETVTNHFRLTTKGRSTVNLSNKNILFV